MYSIKISLLLVALASSFICFSSAQEKALVTDLPTDSSKPILWENVPAVYFNSSGPKLPPDFLKNLTSITNLTSLLPTEPKSREKIIEEATELALETIKKLDSMPHLDLQRIISPDPNHSQSIKKIIDLSHPLDNNTLHWPTNSGFNYTSQKDGELHNQRHEPYYLKSDSISTAIHSGTHLDAPRHFSKSGWTVDKIPLERLIDVPVHVIDLSRKVKADRTYNFQKQDFIDSVSKKSLVSTGSVVLVYTGISEFYSLGEKSYFGTDTKKVSELKLPGFGREAAEYLVERGVFGVGLDAPSADSSDKHDASGTMDPIAHVIFNTNNIYILENISNRLAEMLKQEDLRLTVAPLAIVEGSGSPVRLVAATAHNDCINMSKLDSPTNAGSIIYPYVTTIFATSMVAFIVTLLIVLNQQLYYIIPE